MRFQHINNCAKIIKTIHIFDIFLKHRKKQQKATGIVAKQIGYVH